MLPDKLKLFICSLLIMATCASTSLASTDVDKMKAVEEMFSSPYTEEMYYRTDRLLLTATGSLQPVHRAPAVASVITAEDIKAIGATHLDEILETVPGLHVALSPLNRLDPIFSVRGIHTSLNPQVLLLINDLPLSELFQGNRPFRFHMPIENISRIEVIRGPGSAVYGADAFAGVVNIITKDSHEIDGSIVGQRLGSFGFYDAWLQHGGTLGGWDISLSLEYQKSDGDNDRTIDSDLQTVFDAAFSTSASLAPGPLETDFKVLDAHLGLSQKNWTIRFWSWLQDDAGMGAGGARALDPSGTQDVSQFLADVTYHNNDLFEDSDMSLRLSYVYRKEDSFFTLFPPGSLYPIGSDGNIDLATGTPVSFPDGIIGQPILIDQHSALDFATLYSGIDRHLWRLGAGLKYLEEDTEEFKNFGPGVIDGTVSPINGTLTDVSNTSFVFMENQNRNLFYVSLQDEWSFAKNWELTAGVRFDHYSDFGDTVNPRAALVWEPRYDLTTKILYGKAFRPPSFSEQFAINNPAILGNPDLDPETIETFELVFDYQPLSQLHTVINMFYYDIDDLIEFVADSNGVTTTAQNAKNQDGYGLELEATWQVTDDFRLHGNFAYQRSKDKTTDEIVPDAPAYQFYLNPHWNFFHEWSLDGQLIWIGDRERSTGDTRSDIENYSLVNLALRRNNIVKNLNGAISVRNLFDEDAREPSSSVIQNDLPLDGRSIYGEISYKF